MHRKIRISWMSWVLFLMCVVLGFCVVLGVLLFFFLDPICHVYVIYVCGHCTGEIKSDGIVDSFYHMQSNFLYVYFHW